MSYTAEDLRRLLSKVRLPAAELYYLINGRTADAQKFVEGVPEELVVDVLRCAVQPKPGPERVVFFDLLSEVRPAVNPGLATQACILQHFDGPARLCQTPAQAAIVYRLAKALPRSRTLRELAEHSGLYINGDYIPNARAGSSLMSAFQDGRVPCIIKRPYDVTAMNRELECYQQLVRSVDNDSPTNHHLVGPLELVKLKVSSTDNPEAAIVMPMYTAPLSRVPHDLVGLPSSTLVDIGNQMLDALRFIHNAGYVHCDVKPDNIFLDPKGAAHLGDYGSMVKKGDTVIERTARYNLSDEDAPVDKAVPEMDHWQLAITLLEKAGGVAWIHISGEPLRLTQVKEAIVKIKDTQLATLLTSLLPSK